MPEMKAAKTRDMHTRLTLDDKPLLGDMPKMEEFSTVCCKICKFPIKTQYVKEHMALRHPDYSAARLREEAERFQVKIMINSIPESLFAAVPSYKSHMLSPVRVTSPVLPSDVITDAEESAAAVDAIYPQLSQVELPPMPAVAVKEEPAGSANVLDAKRHSLVDDPEVVSSEVQLGAVLSLKTEVPGALVDILNEFESDAGGGQTQPAVAAAAAAPEPVLDAPLRASPAPTSAPVLAAAQPPPPPPPATVAPPAAPAAAPPPPPAPTLRPPPSQPEPAAVVSPSPRHTSSEAEPAGLSDQLTRLKGSLPARKPAPSPLPPPSAASSSSSSSSSSRLGHLPRQYDPKKHCGVWITERSKHCTRVLDCRQHNLEQKSKVVRPVPFRDLLQRFKAGKTRERDVVKPMSVRYDPKFPPPEGHPAAGLASPQRSGPPGMTTYHNITNSPVFRRQRSSSADGDGMPPPPPRAAPAAAVAAAGPAGGGPAWASAVEVSVPRVPVHPAPLAVGGASHLLWRGGCLSLVDRAEPLRAAVRGLFQPARRGQQSLLKLNQPRSTTVNGQLPGKRPPEPGTAAGVAKKQRGPTVARPSPQPPQQPPPPRQQQQQPPTPRQQPQQQQVQQHQQPPQPHQQQLQHLQQQPQQSQQQPQQPQPQQPQQQQPQQAQLQQQPQGAVLNLQAAAGGRGLALGPLGAPPLNIQLAKGGLPQNIRLTLPGGALTSLQGIAAADGKMIAINSNKVPINRMAGGGAGVSLGQRLARISTPSTLPVHHMSQQVLGQIQLPRLPGAAGLTLKVQPQGGLVMRPEQS